jgi:PadR family transcriptional regulator, regulatory protein PadR
MARDQPGTPALLQGTLDMLVLATLARRPAHGYAIARSIEQASGATLKIEEGSLYPALRRLSRAGAIDAEWQTTPAGRRGKVYRLSREGRGHLEQERTLWHNYTAAIARVLAGGAGYGPFDIEGIGD